MKDLNSVFWLQADSSASLSWRVLPARNLLELCQHAPDRPSSSICLTRQIEPRLMKLLCLLAAAEGQVLTRDELMTALWPRVVVNENSLTRAVSDLRKALNPEPVAAASQTNAMIETVPKRGYRLDTPVLGNEPGPANITQVSVQSALATAPVLQRRPGAWAGLAIAMSLSAVVSSIWTQHWLNPADDRVGSALVAEAPIEVERASVALTPAPMAPQLLDQVISEPMTLPEGLQWRESVHLDQQNLSVAPAATTAAVVAPDGRFMAFVEAFPGQSQLRLRSLIDSSEAWTVFSSHAPITHLQWSPLDNGLLFTVQDTVLATPAVLSNGAAPDTASSARLARLMLLDLESMEIRELYRRAVPAELPADKDIYSAGSGNLT